MSIFASRTQQVLALPFDPPHTVTIQQLAGRQLEQARQASQAAAVATLQRMGGPAFQKELGGMGDPTAVAKLVAEAHADPLTGFDRDVVLLKGIKAWSYDEPVTPSAIEDLREEAADFLARAILELTLPARDAAGKKTASGSSTGP